MFKFLMSAVVSMVLLSGCQTPFSPGDVDNINKWTTRVEFVARDIAVLAKDEAVAAWSGKVADLLQKVRADVNEGKLQDIPSVIEAIRATKPELVDALRAAKLDENKILLLVLGLDTVLTSLEEAL